MATSEFEMYCVQLKKVCTVLCTNVGVDVSRDKESKRLNICPTDYLVVKRQ